MRCARARASTSPQCLTPSGVRATLSSSSRNDDVRTDVRTLSADAPPPPPPRE